MLLTSRKLREIIPGNWAPVFEVEGAVLEHDSGLLAVPGLLCPGAERYVAGYDEQVDVITSWVAFVKGSVGEVRRLDLIKYW